MRFIPETDVPADDRCSGTPRPVSVLIVAGRLWGEAAQAEEDVPRRVVRALVRHREDLIEVTPTAGRPWYVRLTSLDATDDHLGPLNEAAGTTTTAWPAIGHVFMDPYCVGVLQTEAPHEGYMHYYPRPTGAILRSKFRLPAELINWIAALDLAGIRLPPHTEWADWNWKDYGRSVGVWPKYIDGEE